MAVVVAALLLSQKPNRTVADVRYLLAATAQKIGASLYPDFSYGPDPYGTCTCSWHPLYGYGLVDAQAALGAPAINSLSVTHGVVGSLTHCTGFRGAAVAKYGAVRSVGIDAEPHDVLPKGVLDAVSLPKERVELHAMPAGLHWDRILFCAKEATYKAWFPLTHRWLGFEDAHITFDVDDSGTAGTFESRILIDPAAESGPSARRRRRCRGHPPASPTRSRRRRRCARPAATAGRPSCRSAAS